ncbi:MAG: carboxylating nicotinate-nucleotide diphosphorylase [Dehalococcoidales bacterium]|nr:carboxylating nicotinate-nucleotide diphosphorylase [Dehalococcoidales bacterium]
MLGDYLGQDELDGIIDRALAEDLGHGDITTDAIIPAGITGSALLLVKENGVLAGIEVARRVFTRVDPALEFATVIKDGRPVRRGDVAGRVRGSFASILKAERTALNFLQRLSGIATLTARYAAEISGTRARIYDTRKTTPGLRALEKYAVRMGGGENHRRHLGEAILIKDNHIAILRSQGMTLEEIVRKARRNAPPGVSIEVEVNSVEEAAEVLRAGADIIMLDNMTPAEMKRVVAIAAGRVKLEASGGVTLATVREIAETGVDMISVGALTHSYRALDISLEYEFPAGKPDS